MATAEQHIADDYQSLPLEVNTFYEQLLFARHCSDPDAEAEAEQKMNSSLTELGDVVRVMGRTAI